MLRSRQRLCSTGEQCLRKLLRCLLSFLLNRASLCPPAAADYASKRSEVKASKALVEAEHEKIAAHTDAVSQLMVETAARAARTDAAIAELSEVRLAARILSL